MIAKWRINPVINIIQDKLDKALLIVGAQAVTYVAGKIRVNRSIVTGNLINSITYSTRDKFLPLTAKTNGSNLSPSESQTVKIGTTVVYAPRVEFGFIGTDSLGRKFNQAPKSFLRAALKENEGKLYSIFQRAVKI
ncbi:hypothetical protein [Immundisolibacter sp.]